jgi:hypothetical protein
MTTTLRNRRFTLARARDQRDYGKLVYTVVCDAQGYALARYGKPQPHLGYWHDAGSAQTAATLYHRANGYDRLQSRKLRAHVARMAKGWY